MVVVVAGVFTRTVTVFPSAGKVVVEVKVPVQGAVVVVVVLVLVDFFGTSTKMVWVLESEPYGKVVVWVVVPV